MGKQQGGRGQRPTGRDVRGGRGVRQQSHNERALGGGARDRGGAFSKDAARKRGAEKGKDARPAARRPVARPAGDFIEGRRATAEALRTGFPVKRALVAEGSRDAALTKLVDDVRAAGLAVRYVPTAELDALSAHGAHQGIALEVGAFPYAELADVLARAGEGPALVVVLGVLLTATTSPQQLTSGVRDLLRPLARLGVPTEVAALAVGVTVQFVPTLLREGRQLMRAQTLRCSIARHGGIMRRAVSYVQLLVPVFVSAFRRAEELSVAMEARGYRIAGRSARPGEERRL